MQRPPTKVRVRQIGNSDIPAVVHLLTKGFPRRGRAYWQQALDRLAIHATPPNYPKYGYLLEADEQIVGSLLLIFTAIGSGPEYTIRCNLSAWYVDPAFRMFATMLSYRALSHAGVTYLNVSPAKHVQPIIEKQGFKRYANGQILALAIACADFSQGSLTVLKGAERPDVPFDPTERDLLLSHMQFGCIGLWCVTSERAYPFLFVPRIVKKIVPCAQLVYSQNIEQFVLFARPIGRFLARRGRPLILVDANGSIPGLVGRYFDDVAPKYYKGPSRPHLGDLIYTEAAMFGL